MKKAVISQPMRGKTEGEIRTERKEVIDMLNAQGYHVIDTVFPDFKNEGNIPLKYLAKSLEVMADVDYVYFMKGWEQARGCRIEHAAAVDYGIEVNNKDCGNVSDGFHTFNELYYQRTVLFSIICNQNKHLSWKSKKHDDGTMYTGMFIAGINTPMGFTTYHIEDRYWNIFDVVELDSSPKFDGYTSDDVLKRLCSLGVSSECD